MRCGALNNVLIPVKFCHAYRIAGNFRGVIFLRFLWFGNYTGFCKLLAIWGSLLWFTTVRIILPTKIPTKYMRCPLTDCAV